MDLHHLEEEATLLDDVNYESSYHTNTQQSESILQVQPCTADSELLILNITRLKHGEKNVGWFYVTIKQTKK